MFAIASRARTLSTLAAAGATLVVALALTPEPAGPRSGCPNPAREHADDGLALSARWQRGEAGDHVVVAITAPGGGPARPALSVAIAIDRSKSMSGEPLEHAKAAAARAHYICWSTLSAYRCSMLRSKLNFWPPPK
jgi:hypothetical protein